MRRILFHIILGLPAALLGFVSINGQYEEKDFTRFTVKDGLSDNAIISLQQDEQGYLWIGTDAGLNRFDGKSFRNYYRATPPLNLSSVSVPRIKRFGKNDLVFVNRAGFALLNTSNYSIRHFSVKDSSSFTTYLNAAWEVFPLPGERYAMTSAAGFYVFNKDGGLLMRHDAYSPKDIGYKRILYARDYFTFPGNKYLIYVDEGNLALYDDEKKSFRELDMSDPRWNIFIHDRMPGGAYWVVRAQVGENKFIFIPYRDDKIIYYDHSTGKKVVSPLASHMTDSLNWESRILKINDSTFALNSSTNGFYILKMDKKTGQFSCDGKKYLRNYKIICLFSDKDNRLWAGTAEGLLKQELTTPVLHAFHYAPEPGKKFTGGFSSVFRYKDKLYAGRFAKSKGMLVINPANMEPLREVEFFGDDSPWNEIRSIEMYHPDTLWIGSNMGIAWYDVKTGRYGKLADLPNYQWAKGILAVLAPPRQDGYAWMCSMLDGKVARYHIPTRTCTVFTARTTPALPFDKVKHVVYDSYGDVWIGGHSLARWNNRLETFDTLITVYGGVNKFNDDIITMKADENGSLWIHNVYNGLLEYRIKEKKFIPLTMQDGLPTEVIHSMSPVIDNKLWIAGNDKLARFDTRSRQFVIYDTEDGLPEQKPSGRRMFYDPVSRLVYLCSNEYLVRFPVSPVRSKDLGSGLFLEEINVSNRKTYYQPAQKLELGHNENNLTINYSIIDFDKSSYHFAYRLNSSDSWNVIGNQRSINLSNLSPGSYSFQLKATGHAGIEKTKEFVFEIRPPFWKTAWFIGLALFVIATGIYLLYRFRVRQIQQKADLDKQISKTEMKALQAQMNPHFIFNSLNSIREMILNNENKDASHYLSKFAHLIRISLNHSSRTLVSLDNTVDYLRRYLEMEKMRNSQFTYSIHVDEQLDGDDTLLPPMLIQPFIENALWHGVTASHKDIHIQIDFIKEGNSLVCSIDDNGVGISKALGSKTETANGFQSMGISNIQTRIRLLNEKYKLHGRLLIQDKKDIPGSTGTGTRVTLDLPLEIKET